MRRIAGIILLFFSITSGVQSSRVLHKPYATQYYFIDSFLRAIDGQPPTNAISKINSTSKWAANNDDNLLADGLTIRTHQYTNNHFPRAQHLSEAVLLKIKARNKNPYMEADILQQLGSYYLNEFRKNNVAFEYYLLAYNLYKDFSPDDFPPKQSYLYELGGSYFRYGDYPNAARYLKTALITKSAFKTDMFITISNTLGICYQYANQLDSSELYLRSAYDYAVKHSDSTWLGILSGNIGTTYYLQGKFAEAIPLLQKDIQLSLSHGQIKSAVLSLTLLSNIFLKQNKLNDAERLLLRARQLCIDRPFWSDYTVAEKLFIPLSQLYAAKNNMRLAYLYADSALVAKDSSVTMILSANMEKAQEKTEYVQRKLEAEKVAGEKRAQSLIRNALIICILLLLVIGILAINRQRLIRNKLEAEKKNAEAELDAATARLISFRQSVEEKVEIIEHYEEMERLKKEEEANTDADVRSQLEQAILVTDEQWDDFRRLFEKVHKGFFSNLKHKIPDLTPAEIRFLTLTKLKLTSKEMASMLGISQNAIRMYRHRLRRKLNLDKDDMIEQLVESL